MRLLILLLIAFSLCACATQRLDEEAARDDALAKKWRTPDADGLMIYYSNMYRDKASQERDEANHMSLMDQLIYGVIDLFIDPLFEGKSHK